MRGGRIKYHVLALRSDGRLVRFEFCEFDDALDWVSAFDLYLKDWCIVSCRVRDIRARFVRAKGV
jgi:hypothetical protein